MNVSPASISLDLAAFRSQALGSLIGSSSAGRKETGWALARQAALDGVPSSVSSILGKAGGLNGVSPAGRNPALFDPESAYRMMSVIKGNDVSYRAQFFELSEMGAAVSQMRDAGQGIGSIDATTGDPAIASRVQDFVAQYNVWVERFDPDMQRGGLLADTQAAQVARHELAQSVESIFNGARDGVHGLADLGVTIDPSSGRASFDSARLDSVLASNRTGAVDALQEFGANFTRSASLLNSDGNFIPNRLNNLDRVIHYFDEHKVALQNEFGSGDSPAPSGRVAQALAAYNQRYGV